MISVGANVTINDDNGFQEVLSRSSKKRKKISPIKSISPLPAQDPPSKNLGIYLKITPTTPFEIKMITAIRVAIFKLLKSMFSLNINRDGSLLIAVEDQKSADTIINLKSLLNTPIIASNWNPKQSPTKIVVYNVPPEISIQELKEGLSDRAGNTIPVEDVTQLGKPNSNGLKTSRSFLFTLKEKINIPEKLFLFGQIKPHKEYKPKPIQCQKCLKLGHTTNKCNEILRECSNCKAFHPKELTTCNNTQPTCINCKGPHESTNKSLCPAYKKRALTLQISTEKAIPYPFAAMEANAAQQYQIKPVMKPTKTPKSNAPNASSTPYKTPSSKPPSSNPYQKESPSQQASLSGEMRPAWPPLPRRNKPETLPGINPLTNKQDALPKMQSPNICLFILNCNAVQAMNIHQLQKTKIIAELAKIYIPDDMLIQAKKDLALLLTKLNIDTQSYEE